MIPCLDKLSQSPLFPFRACQIPEAPELVPSDFSNMNNGKKQSSNSLGRMIIAKNSTSN